MAKTAIDLLKEDHKRLRKMLDELVATSGAKTRERLLAKVSSELEVHTGVEEEIFYPAFRDAATKKEQKKLYYEAVEEHRAVNEMVLPDLAETDTSGLEFGGRAKVLRELVLHHLEEEEQEMFKLARQLLSREELVELGEHIEGRKKELFRELKAA
jgi:hemerythrin-like domain-containing protein